jgi:hypothetical protein
MVQRLQEKRLGGLIGASLGSAGLGGKPNSARQPGNQAKSEGGENESLHHANHLTVSLAALASTVTELCAGFRYTGYMSGSSLESRIRYSLLKISTK